MTTATIPQPTLPHRSSFARVPAVFRLQFAVRYSFIWLPIAIFLLAWAFGYGVLILVDSQIPDRIPAQEPLHATGAAQATIWYLAFMAGYTGSHTFPFSLALSYSRRVYLIGTYLTFLVVAAGYGVAAMLAYLVERVTNGFGNHMYIFGSPSFEHGGGAVGVGAFAAVVALFFMCFGFFWAILYRRVSIPILWTVIIGVIVALLGILALITVNEWWPHVGAWINGQNAFSLAGYGFGATVVLGVLNYLLIRKATAN